MERIVEVLILASTFHQLPPCFQVIDFRRQLFLPDPVFPEGNFEILHQLVEGVLVGLVEDKSVLI